MIGVMSTKAEMAFYLFKLYGAGVGILTLAFVVVLILLWFEPS